MKSIENDTYFTICKISEGEYSDKGSRFIGFAFPFVDLEQLKPILTELRNIHPKARHFCYGYKIGIDGNNYRTNDDGEPSGSAGKPILNSILSQNLTNILIVVLRYFGGTLLGVPGLINAYKSASLRALENSLIETKFFTIKCQISFEFEKTNEIMRIIKEFEVKILKQDYFEKCIWDVEFRQSFSEIILGRLNDMRCIHIEM